MNVLMITERYHPIWGGAENQLRQLVPYLQKRGCCVRILTRRWHRDASRTEIVDGARVCRTGVAGQSSFASVVFTMSMIVRILQDAGTIDIIHSHGAAAMAAAGKAAAMLTGKKSVCKIATAGRITGLRRQPAGRLILPLFKRSDAVVCISNEIHNELMTVGTSPRAIYRIPNAVDAKKFKPFDEGSRERWRRQRHIAADAPVVMFSGRLVERKGLDNLIDAWTEVHGAFPEAHLFILGSGTLQPDSVEGRIRERIRSTGMRHIHLEGQTATPEKYLGVADVFVFPSRREGFPNALLEAMASGLAIVATRIGGVTDLVQDSRTGLLYDVNDASQLAEKMKILLGNRNLRVEIGRRARRHVLCHYDFESIASKYMQLYRSICRSKTRR